MPVLKFYNTSTGQWEAISAGPAGPQGAPGITGAQGPQGPAGTAVEVGDNTPVVGSIQLWVDPDDFQGENGWQGFDSRYVNVTGDTMTGVLKIPDAAAATDAMNRQASDARYLIKSSTAQTVTGPVTFQGLTTVPTPASPGEAANKGYVDGRIVVAASAPTSPAVGQLWAQP